MMTLFRITWHALKSTCRAFDIIYNRIMFCCFNISCCDFPSTSGKINLRNHGSFFIGSNVTLNSSPDVVPIGGDEKMTIRVLKEASLYIGDRVGMTNVTIYCSRQVIIDDEVFIGRGCKIYDTDFHSLRLEDRLAEKFGILSGKSAPVAIHRGCFIGAGTFILKGTEIGERSVIGAGSVVSKSVPPKQVWAGNPARYIRDLRADELE